MSPVGEPRAAADFRSRESRVDARLEPVHDQQVAELGAAGGDLAVRRPGRDDQVRRDIGGRRMPASPHVRETGH